MNLSTLMESGLTGLLLALLVLVIVYISKFTNLVKNGDFARLSNVFLSLLFSGLPTTPDSAEKQIVFVVCALASAAIHELFSYLKKRSDKFRLPDEQLNI